MIGANAPGWAYLGELAPVTGMQPVRVDSESVESCPSAAPMVTVTSSLACEPPVIGAA